MIESPLGTRTAALAVAVGLAGSLALAQAPVPVPPGPPPISPAKGEVVPAFETLGMDGKAWKVDFPKGSKTVLLFFLSGCPHCHKMVPEWNRAFEKHPRDLRILGVIMDPDQTPASFWQTMPIAFPVLRSPGSQFLRSINVNRAPLTLRVAEGGRVEDLAIGELCSGGAPAGTCVDAITLGQLFAPAR
jgi:peroxiredoxin